MSNGPVNSKETKHDDGFFVEDIELIANGSD